MTSAELADFALRTIVTLVVVVDPLGLVPAYLSLAGMRPQNERATVPRRAVVIAGAVLVSFAVVGGPLLAYLGISLGALQVAGGILLFRIALGMVFARFRRETAEEAAEARSRDDISVFPLAIPLIAGPGAIASVLIVTSEAGGDVAAVIVVLAALIAVLVACWLFLRAANRIASMLGQTGINVVTRVFGILLAALAVQYAANGLLALGIVAR
jgi:multiple antibiotic resistance protein